MHNRFKCGHRSKDKREQLETLASELLEKEILFQSDLERLIGARPFDRKTTYEAFTENKEEDVEEKDPDVKPTAPDTTENGAVEPEEEKAEGPSA